MRGGEVRVVALADLHHLFAGEGARGRGSPPSPQPQLERAHPQKSDPQRPLKFIAAAIPFECSSADGRDFSDSEGTALEP